MLLLKSAPTAKDRRIPAHIENKRKPPAIKAAKAKIMVTNKSN